MRWRAYHAVLAVKACARTLERVRARERAYRAAWTAALRRGGPAAQAVRLRTRRNFSHEEHDGAAAAANGCAGSHEPRLARNRRILESSVAAVEWKLSRRGQSTGRASVDVDVEVPGLRELGCSIPQMITPRRGRHGEALSAKRCRPISTRVQPPQRLELGVARGSGCERATIKVRRWWSRPSGRVIMPVNSIGGNNPSAEDRCATRRPR